MMPVVDDEDRWTAVVNRDRSADDRFFYAVATTGIYCRPSCGSRLPRREHVRFFPTRADAEYAGFRPCKRCKPNMPDLGQRQAERVAETCRLLESSDTAPNLATLAAKAGMSPYHFHRVFKAITGVTPKAYASAARAQRVREALRQADTVTEAMYDAGFQSSGRFYASAGEILGMAPAAYRAGGRNETIHFSVGGCSLGAVLVAATMRGVCAVLLGDDEEQLVQDLQVRFPRALLLVGDAQFTQLVNRVVAMVEAPASAPDLPLDIRGTAFQQRVWQALREIPPGATASYTEIAVQLGMPNGARAVAQACAANAIAVAIPCHRVVRTDGALSGYRWGVERKRELLRREAEGPSSKAAQASADINRPGSAPSGSDSEPVDVEQD